MKPAGIDSPERLSGLLKWRPQPGGAGCGYTFTQLRRRSGEPPSRRRTRRDQFDASPNGGSLERRQKFVLPTITVL